MSDNKPSISGSSGFKPLAECPKCCLLMYIYDDKCPHCDYVLKANEKEEQNQYYKNQNRKGYKLGAIFTIGFIFLFFLLFYHFDKGF